MNARNLSERGAQSDRWAPLFEDWMLELVLAAAVFAAVVNGIVSLSGA
jgi:hypothetical protein